MIETTQFWIAVCHDRHEDEDVTIHRTREAAIEYAWNYMRDHVAKEEWLVGEDQDDGRFEITYELESDRAFVCRATIEADAYNRLLTALKASRTYVAYAFDQGIMGAEEAGLELDAAIAAAEGLTAS